MPNFTLASFFTALTVASLYPPEYIKNKKREQAVVSDYLNYWEDIFPTDFFSDEQFVVTIDSDLIEDDDNQVSYLINYFSNKSCSFPFDPNEAVQQHLKFNQTDKTKHFISVPFFVFPTETHCTNSDCKNAELTHNYNYRIPEIGQVYTRDGPAPAFIYHKFCSSCKTKYYHAHTRKDVQDARLDTWKHPKNSTWIVLSKLQAVHVDVYTDILTAFTVNQTSFSGFAADYNLKHAKKIDNFNKWYCNLSYTNECRLNFNFDKNYVIRAFDIGTLATYYTNNDLKYGLTSKSEKDDKLDDYNPR